MSLKDVEAKLLAMERILNKSLEVAQVALEQSKAANAEIAAIKARADAAPVVPVVLPADPPKQPTPAPGAEMFEVTNESLFPFTLPDNQVVGPFRSTEANDLPNRAIVPKWVIECRSMRALIDPPDKTKARYFTVRPVSMTV